VRHAGAESRGKSSLGGPRGKKDQDEDRSRDGMKVSEFGYTTGLEDRDTQGEGGKVH